MFGAEHGADLKDALVYRHEHLFVKLRTLREEYLLPEIVELENVRAALRALRVDFWGPNFREALRKQEIAETARNTLLDFEHRALFGIAQRYRAHVQIQVERYIVQLLFIDDDGHHFGGGGEHFDVVNLHLVAALARFVLDDLAREFDRAAFDHLFVHAVAGEIGRIHALHHVARGADNDERKTGHLADAVDHPLHSDDLVHVFGELFIAYAVVFDTSVYLFHTITSLNMFRSLL